MSSTKQTLRLTADESRGMFPTHLIKRLVHEFYAEVQKDPLVGPVFANRITDWTPHLNRMIDFWRAILLGEPGFTPSTIGGPPAVHRAIAELSLDHFERWLELFSRTAHNVFEPRAADYVVLRATRIGTVLSSHLKSPE